MSTVGQLIDRAYREWLRLPSDMPALAELNGAIDNAIESPINLTLTMLTPAEQDQLGRGIVLEIDAEQILVRSFTSPNVTARRGYNGTTAAAHANKAAVYLASDFPRSVILDGIADAVVNLFPRLYGVDSVPILTSDRFIPVDSEVESIEKIWYELGGEWWEGEGMLMSNFPPSPSGKAIRTWGMPSGRAAYLVFRTAFARPTAEADDLSDPASFRIDPAWERAIVVAAVAWMIRTKDIDSATQEFLTERLEIEGFPVGAGEAVARGFERLYDSLMRQNQTALRSRNLGRTLDIGVTL